MKRICRRSVLLTVIIAVLLVSLCGCAAKKTGDVNQDQGAQQGATAESQTPAGGATAQPASSQAQTNVEYYIHTVKWSGESVSIIAGWYLGDIHKWEILRDCNPDRDPKVVRIGDRIRIPESLMTTKSPMTKAHVDKFYPKAERHERHKTRPSHSEQKDEVPTLYGPK